VKMTHAIPALPVSDVPAAVVFYRDKLGFEPFYQEEEFARLRRSEVEIHLWKADDQTWTARPVTDPFPSVVSGAESFLAGTASCRIAVQDIETFYGEYRAAGVLHDSHPEIRAQWWGEREFHVLDPDHNLISFFEPNQ